MARIFLSTSFSAHVEASGAVSAQFRSELGSLIDAIEQSGYKVDCAVRDDGWMIQDMDPAAAYRRDIEAIRRCDGMVALLQFDPPSVGVQFELGFGQAVGLPLVMACAQSEVLPYINEALAQQPGVRLVRFASIATAAPGIITGLQDLGVPA